MILLICDNAKHLPETTGLAYPDVEIFVYLVVLFVTGLGLGINSFYRKHPNQGSLSLFTRKNHPSNIFPAGPVDSTAPWNQRDTLFILLLTMAALVIRLALLTLREITADEAAGLDPFFFTRPFTQWETMVNPPFFRLILHANSWNRPLSLFFIRLPSAIFGTLTIPVAYLLVRSKDSRTSASIVALCLALFPLHIEYSILERSYALWLLLILAGQLAFERFEDSAPLAWLVYYISTFLAVMTHYLTVPYVLAQGFHGFRRGETVFKKWKFAALPSLAALIPFAVYIASEKESFMRAIRSRPDGTYLETVAAQIRTVTLDGGFTGVLALIAITAVTYLRLNHLRSDDDNKTKSAHIHYLKNIFTSSRATTGLAGLFAAFFLGTEGRKYALPAVALLFAWSLPSALSTASKIKTRRKAFILFFTYLSCFLFIAFPALSAFKTWRPTGVRAFIRSAESKAGRKNHLAVYPRSEFRPVFFTITGRRDPWKSPCPSPQNHWTGLHKGRWILALHESLTQSDLEQLLDETGRFDLLYVTPTNHPITDNNAGIVKQFIRNNCILRLKGSSNKPRRPHRLYHCSLQQ